MQAIIFAGGMPSALSRDERIPKPMVEVGGKPLLWHIMKSCSEHGIKDFVVCGGCQVEKIKQYFQDFYLYQSDITVDLENNKIEIHEKRTEDWRVTVVNTGEHTSTLQRLALVKRYAQESFLVTYGDCLTDLPVEEVNARFEESGRMAAMILARPVGRKQMVLVEEDGSLKYGGASPTEGLKQGWVDAGIYLMRRPVLDRIGEDAISEQILMTRLASEQQLMPYYHGGYWSSIETMRDLVAAQKLWEQGVAPWAKP